jgi:hypothetical protein
VTDIASPIRTLLAPQGAEAAAVRRGLGAIAGAQPTLLSIPMGPGPTAEFLTHSGPEIAPQTAEKPGGVLLLGLGGGLSPQLQVGDVVLLQQCQAGFGAETMLACDRTLTAWLQQRLAHSLTRVSLGVGVSCDRIIRTPLEKQQLHQTQGADVVDMESLTVLKMLQARSIPVAVIRVISDDCQTELPDLATALGSDGSLNPWPLTRCFLRQPRAAAHLIWGSLQALQQLRTLAAQL